MNQLNVEAVSRYRDYAPGVYLELSVEQKPISFQTGVPVFVGFGQKILKTGNENDDIGWIKLLSWKELNQYVDLECQLPHGSNSSLQGYLSAAVRGFFENGGETCYVLPVPWPKNLDPEMCIASLKQPFLDVSLVSVVDKETKPYSLLGILENLDEIDLVCVPDLVLCGGYISGENSSVRNDVIDAQREILGYCTRMGNRFAILDAYPIEIKENAPIPDFKQKIIDQRFSVSGSSGALYFPWICIHQGGDKLMRIPPCGHIAGIYARSDAQTGVFKAPANEAIEGAFDLDVSLSGNDQAELSHAGVNCLKSSLSRGIRVWGAKTLSVHTPDQYISIKRLFLTMTRWVEKNMSDLTFEANNVSLWNRIQFRMEGYCFELFQKGALKGKSPGEAYFVKCDRELNTVDSRELGKVIVEVGLACVAPAEFIIVRISQSASGITTTALAIN